MDENVISWNLPNVVSIVFMVLIIWIVFGVIGHVFFRTAGSTSSVAVAQPVQVLGV